MARGVAWRVRLAAMRVNIPVPLGGGEALAMPSPLAELHFSSPHQQTGGLVHFSPDGRLVACAAAYRLVVRDVETLEVVLEDDGDAELLLDAATRDTLRKAMGLLAAKAEADDAAFFWGDD